MDTKRKQLKNLQKIEKRKARKKIQAARAHWAQLAAHKLTQMGHPTTPNCGYAILSAKIQMVCPYIKGSRADVFAKFVGEGEEAARLRTEYVVARNAVKFQKKNRRLVRSGFYESREWRELRYRALVLHGGACQACGATAKDGVKLHVDHIKPRSLYPDLQLELKNLQVLCETCNLGKSNIDATDWRPEEFAA